MASSTNAAVAVSESPAPAVEKSSGAGWNAVRRGAWQSDAVLSLMGPKPAADALYFWLHSVVGPVPGVYQSAARSLALQLAALGGFDAAHIEQMLAELARRGLLLRELGSLYLPDCLRDTCAAPTSQYQLPSWTQQIERLGPVLRQRVTRDLLDVTARADTERVRRRKPGVEPLFDRLKRALGVGLCAMPSEPQELQLSLPFSAPRPEVRIMKPEDLDEQAVCMLALIGDQDGTASQNAEASAQSSRVDGEALDSGQAPVGLFDGDDRMAPATAARAHTAVLAGAAARVRRLIGEEHAHDGAPVRGVVAAEEHRAAGSIRLPRLEADAGLPGAGLRASGGLRLGDVPPGRTGKAGELRPVARGVQAQLPEAPAVATGHGCDAEAKAAWEAIRKGAAAKFGLRPDPVSPLGIDLGHQMMFEDSFKLLKPCGYELADYERVGEWIAAGLLDWRLQRGMSAWKFLIKNLRDCLEGAESWDKGGRKKEGQGSLPQPALAAGDDLNDLFGAPQRSAK